jgi:hypothetical protein
VEKSILNGELKFPVSEFENVSQEAQELMKKLMMKDPE